MEILIVTSAVAQLIRDGKTFQIPSAIATGRRLGMQLMDQSLIALVRSGDIDPDEAYLKAVDKREFAPFVTKPELLTWNTGAGASPGTAGTGGQGGTAAGPNGQSAVANGPIAEAA
jgi:hypothetical protein